MKHSKAYYEKALREDAEFILKVTGNPSRLIFNSTNKEDEYHFQKLREEHEEV